MPTLSAVTKIELVGGQQDGATITANVPNHALPPALWVPYGKRLEPDTDISSLLSSTHGTILYLLTTAKTRYIWEGDKRAAGLRR